MAEYRAGNVASGHRIVQAHLGYAVSVVYRHNPRTSSLDDMIQVANLGLLRALETFDPSRGRFVTYADQWIRNRISTWMHKSREIQVPTDAAGRRAVITANRHGAANAKEVARHRKDTGVIDAIVYWASAKRLSAESSAGRGPDEDEWIDWSVKDTLPSYDKAVDPILRESIERALSRLTARERVIVLARLDDVGLREIAEAHGITRQRVAQIEGVALGKLRRALARTWDEMQEAA